MRIGVRGQRSLFLHNSTVEIGYYNAMAYGPEIGLSALNAKGKYTQVHLTAAEVERLYDFLQQCRKEGLSI